MTHLGVPLHLSRSTVHHRAGEYSHDCAVHIQNTLLHDCVVLFDTHGQGHVIVLGEASQRVQEQHWVLGGVRVNMLLE